MTLLGSITVKLSDDERYKAGETYDVVLQTLQTPDPATLVQGTIEDPPVPAPADAGTPPAA